jgi:hypothetical protein
MSENFKLILARIYLSFSVLLFAISNLGSSINLYDSYVDYSKDKNIYERIRSLENAYSEEIKSTFHSNFCTQKQIQDKNWKCSIKQMYDKSTGNKATTITVAVDKVSFSELDKPSFDLEALYILFGTLLLLPIVLYLFKRWAIWVSNTKKAEHEKGL